MDLVFEMFLRTLATAVGTMIAVVHITKYTREV